MSRLDFRCVLTYVPSLDGHDCKFLLPTLYLMNDVNAIPYWILQMTVAISAGLYVALSQAEWGRYPLRRAFIDVEMGFVPGKFFLSLLLECRALTSSTFFLDDFSQTGVLVSYGRTVYARTTVRNEFFVPSSTICESSTC
jgi:hypothetical protein